MRVGLCYERISSAERNERERGTTQCTNNSDPITSTSELLLRAKQSHCARSQILGSPTCVRPLRNRDPPAKIRRPTYTLRFAFYFMLRAHAILMCRLQNGRRMQLVAFINPSRHFSCSTTEHNNAESCVYCYN
jgi:hypothetical protein